MSTSTRHSGEQGQAMTVAIIILLIAGALGTVIVANSQETSRSVSEAKQKIGTVPHMKSAVAKYELALQLGIANEANGWRIPAGQWSRILDPVSDSTIGTGSTTFSTSPVAGLDAVTVREDIGNNRYGFWQIQKVELPRYGDAGANDYHPLTVYFRGWVGEATSPQSTPVTWRAQFRPTYFSDYQMVSDGAIPIGPGFRITGHVHSNGFLDGTSLPTGSSTNRVWIDAGGSLACVAPSAYVTTARGDVSGGIGGAGCRVGERTGRYISMLRAEEAFQTIEAACGTRVVCG